MERAGQNTWAVTTAVAMGGAVGAVARYSVASAWPQATGGFPLTTLAVNLIGCLLIGVLMTLLRQALAANGLLRPFLGVGVLGGFTTFSTYAAESLALFQDEAALTALAYLAATLVGALVAVFSGMRVTETVHRLITRRGTSRRRDLVDEGERA